LYGYCLHPGRAAQAAGEGYLDPAGEALPDKFHFFYRENSTLPEKGGFLKENDENCGVLKRRQE